MIVRFGLDLADNPWPGPLAGRVAAAGEPWVGSRGMLSILETQLGLTGLRPSAVQRAATFVPAVEAATEAFWAKSAANDPLGVARELLRWRDELCMAGWTGQPVAPRLAALAEVTAEAPPGRPDRIRAVLAALADQPVDLQRVILLGTTNDELPVLWRRVLEMLEKRGVPIELQAVGSSGSAGDLAACLGAGFTPVGDGSLLLLRSEGPLAAAEQVAAWLATRDDLDGTVLINPDEQLDHALHRRGLPTTGLADDSADDALLQVLPLVLELAWAPQDPRVAHELIMLARSPVPRGIARRLMGALREWPAVGSDDWFGALAAGLAGVEDDARRDRLRARLDSIFTPDSDNDVIAADAVRRRLAVILPWLRGHVDGAGEYEGRWKAAIEQCNGLVRLLDSTGAAEISRSTLRRLVEAVTSDAPRMTPFDAKAGLHAVRRPGAVLGPARRIVWWEFTRNTAGVPRPLPLDRTERAALVAAGVELPDPGARAESNARRWRHPFLCAGEHLLLVAPRCGGAGDPAHPHPVWDEVTARLDDRARAMIEKRELPDPPRDHELAPLARSTPSPEWTLPNPGAVKWPKSWSPTGANTLIGCPLRWTLSYAGGLRPGQSETLPDGALVLGNVAHRVLETVLGAWNERGGIAPGAAADEAAAVFDRDGPRLAALLFQPGTEPQRDDIRAIIRHAAAELAQILGRADARIGGMEQKTQGDRDGMRLNGRADLLLSSPPAVIDIKWGSGDARRDDLRRGSASQLAVYATLFADGGVLPAVAYFILTRQRMYAQDDAALPGADKVEGPTMTATLAGFRDALEHRIGEIRDGVIRAPAAIDDPEGMENNLENGRLVLAPECRYCNFAAICRGGET